MKNKEILNKTPIRGKMSQEELSDEERIDTAKNEINQNVDLKQNLNATSCLNAEDTGRSMTEMLGTLAVIGVLSVVGITGYQYALNQYRANQVANEINFLRNELQIKIWSHHKQLRLGTPYDEGKMQYGDYDFAYDCGDGTTIPTDCQEEEAFTIQIDNISKEICNPLTRLVSNLPQLDIMEVNGKEEVVCKENNTVTLVFARDDIVYDSEGLTTGIATGTTTMTSGWWASTWGPQIPCETNADCDGDMPFCYDAYCVPCERVDWSKPFWNETNQTCEACSSGTGWDGSSCVSTCPADKPLLQNSHCYTCADRYWNKQVWDETSKTCVACSSGTGWDGSSCVTCPADKPVLKNSRCYACINIDWYKPFWNEANQTCVACPSGEGWDGSSCIECPEDKPVSYNSRCYMTCSNADGSKPVWNETSKTCVACPSGTGWDGSSCVECPSEKPVSQNSLCYTCANWYGSSKPVWDETSKTCVACSSGTEWNGSKCEASCQANTDCDSLGRGYYCKIVSYKTSGSCSSSNPNFFTNLKGACAKIGGYDSTKVRLTTGLKTMYKSNASMNWWSAKNWCEALGKNMSAQKNLSLLNASNLGCYKSGTTTPFTIGINGTTGACCASGKACYQNKTAQSEAMHDLRDEWSGSGWTVNNYYYAGENSCTTYYVYLSSGQIYGGSWKSSGLSALCE